MISHGKDIKVFCGNANQPLAAEICQMMGTKLGESEVKSFADGEVSVALLPAVSPPSSPISAMPVRTARPRPAIPSLLSWWPT